MKTLLHIEDDPSLQKLVRLAMGGIKGLQVQTAADGFQAVEMACNQPPDIVLLDEGLPGMSGSDTYVALRKVAGLAGVPILFLTGSTNPSTHGRLIGLGAHDILVKPCRPTLLVQAVSMALNVLTASRPAHVS